MADPARHALVRPPPRHRPSPAEWDLAHARMAAALDAAEGQWIWETDAALKVTYLSEAFETLTGRTPDSMLGVDLREQIQAANRTGEADAALAAITHRQRFRDVPCTIMRRGSQPRHYRISGVPWYGEQGEFAGFRGLTVDVTREMTAISWGSAAAAALKESERRFHSIFEGAFGMLILLDVSGRIVEVNRSILTATGLPADEVLGEEFCEASWWWRSPETLAQVSAGLAQAVRGNPYRGEVTILNAAGEPSHIDLSLQPLRSSAGNVFSILVEGRDITFRKQVEERARALELELMQAHKMEALGTLAGGIAHEINTPVQYVGDNLGFIAEGVATLTSIIQAWHGVGRACAGIAACTAPLAAARDLEAAADLDFLFAELPDALRQSTEGLQRVREIVTAVKLFSYPDRSLMEPQDLSRAVENTATVCRNQWKGVADLVLELDPTLTEVVCHLGEINQVIMNLITNAAHAIEDRGDGRRGRITITTRREGSWALLSVADTGCGIPAEIRSRIFDLFFTTKGPGRGTGQGLALCHTIIKRHGGSLNVESEPGIGSTLTVRLPIRRLPMPGTCA